MSGTSPPSDFQQLTLLRKAFIKKDSGELSYESQSGRSGHISLHTGQLITDHDTEKNLALFFSGPVSHCSWNRRILGNSNLFDPTLAISKAINSIQWDDNIIFKLKFLFLKLPPVHVRMVPLHRYGYNDGLTYLMLHQQSMMTNAFSLSHFLNDAKDTEMLRRRVKVVVLGYCLGLITAQPKQQKNTNKNSTAGIASRILQRIRGL